MNKQGTLFFWNVLLIHERTIIAATECWWPYWKLPECSALKTQTTAPRLLHTFLIYPPLMHKQSSSDITKWHQNHLLPLFSGKGTVHVQESYNDLPAHLSASPLTIFYSYTWTMSSFPYPEFWACDIYIDFLSNLNFFINFIDSINMTYMVLYMHSLPLILKSLIH